MLGPEYPRLLQHYEMALRRWSARIEKKKALDERDAAKERLNRHVRTCPTCIHNHHNLHLVK
jgi:hypothetical protein